MYFTIVNEKGLSKMGALETRLERLPKEKHFIFLDFFMNYNCEKFVRLASS
jgi:hypothetical protein